MFFSEAGGLVSTSIYDRYRLLSENAISGPAIVEEIDSTTVIHPGYIGTVDSYGNILIEQRER